MKINPAYEDQVYFQGEVESIFFTNDSNFYKVILARILKTDAPYEDTEIVITGTMGEVLEGDIYTFRGIMSSHPKYGDQLKLTSYEKNQPKSPEGLIKFLSSDKFPGIGQVTARKIVTAYPSDTIHQILEDPSGLAPILSGKKLNQFVKHLADSSGQDKILADLTKYGLSMQMNLRILDTYGQEALEKIKENPYRLVEEVQGIGFKLADQIAESLGIPLDHPGRIRAGLFQIVNLESRTKGDTYIPTEELLSMTQYLLQESRQVDISNLAIKNTLDELLKEGKLKDLDHKIFENSIYEAEGNIKIALKNFLKKDTKLPFSMARIQKAIDRSEEKLNLTYDSRQKEAIVQAMTRQFSLLTGGPGTGKTTIIRGLIEVYAMLEKIDLEPNHYTDQLFPILLAAPTGRAARRMTEVTGLPAATLHRHLGIGREAQELEPTNDLSGNLLIVDEFSMVDTWLAAQLFLAIPEGMRVVLVGDGDQLPSVGPGQVFSDLFRIPQIPHTSLETIYRQSSDSTIVELASAIKRGEFPQDFTSQRADRNFFPVEASQVPHLVKQIAESWKKRGNSVFEFQVLAPMYKGKAGINHLNQTLQEVFNPLEQRVEFYYKEMKFRPKDKILHLVNDPETGVFNGDLGIIQEVIPAKYTDSDQDELIINFDGMEVTYPRSEWYKITLAYAMSIHKAQGSEFQTVILPMVSSFNRMLERNLLYTGITRAKTSLILLGELSSFQQAVSNQGTNRRTYLIQRFLAENKSSPKLAEKSTRPILTDSLIENQEIDPLIGLKEEDMLLFI